MTQVCNGINFFVQSWSPFHKANWLAFFFPFFAVLITGGITPFAITCAQLAKHWGTRVFLTTHEGSGSRSEREALDRDGVRDTFGQVLSSKV
jgi:hypothetical protein